MKYGNPSGFHYLKHLETNILTILVSICILLVKSFNLVVTEGRIYDIKKAGALWPFYFLLFNASCCPYFNFLF